MSETRCSSLRKKKTDMPSSAKVKRLQSESLHSCHFFLFPTSKRIAIGLRTILMQAVLSVVSISFESRVMPTQMCNLRDYFMFGPEHSGVIRLMKPSKRQGEIWRVQIWPNIVSWESKIDRSCCGIFSQWVCFSFCET